MNLLRKQTLQKNFGPEFKLKHKAGAIRLNLKGNKKMKITLYDAVGNALEIGDLLHVQEKRNTGYLTFYVKLQIKNGSLYPFKGFSFDRVIKIDTLPNDVKHCEETEIFPEYWMHPKQELFCIEKGILEKWKYSAFLFEYNNFIKFSEN